MGVWTDQGFIANTVEFYKEKIQKLFIEAFGDEFLLDDTLPQGILITRIAELAYGLDMDGVEAFSRLNINTASGVYLDLMGALRGMPRKLGTPQLATVTIKSNATNFLPFTIPQGQIFTTIDGNESFEAVSGKTIDSPVATLSLRYTEAGNSEATVGGKMQTTGLSVIQDVEITYLMDGMEAETDIEYRTRMRSSYPAAGQTIEYIENLIRELQFVKTVGHNYNDQATTVDTLPAYSTEFMAVPKPGTDMTLFKDSIASIILNNKMPGAPTAGNTTVTATDVFGTSKQIKFTIPTEVKLQINVQVGTPETTGYIDLSLANDIIVAIADYINNLDIGKDVSYSRCMAPLTADKGFDVLNFQIRVLPNAAAWDPAKDDYTSSSIVRYQNVFYKGAVANPQGIPGVSSDWVVYNDGWVNNKNFSIENRQYASITLQDITIGA